MRRNFTFMKFQGCGNDFIIRDEMRGLRTSDAQRSRLARLLTDRHFKIGADGLIFIDKVTGADGSMRLFEPAGNEADMCGNGIRCVARYLSDKLGKPELDILTRDGIKHVVRIGDELRVDMGIVRTTRKNLRTYVTDKGNDSDSMLRFSLRAAGRQMKASIVNSGEPHIVVRVKRIADVDVVGIGEEINENRKRFPTGVNINFVEVASAHKVKTRTYERGVYDETLACGTGATASAAVALLLKWVRPGTVTVRTLGGTIKVDMDRHGRALMTGPAECEFEGSLAVRL